MSELINQSIDSRNTAKGKPQAIILFDEDLNNRQKKLLDKLQNYDDTVIIRKKDVGMKDLSALTAHEDVEFALFTRGNQRMVIRGAYNHVMVTEEMVAKLNDSGWRWSGHTHPGIENHIKTESEGDRRILRMFNQEQSVIYDSKGRYKTYGKN